MPKNPSPNGRPAPDELKLVQLLLRSAEAGGGLRIMGDRWSLLILRDVFLGVRRFEELRRLTGAARATLTTRLNTLVANGILYRNPYQEAPTRHEYRLTDKGLALYPVTMMLWSWESKWGGQHNLPPRLVHKTCGRTTLPRLACAHCATVVDPHDVDYAPGPGLGGRMARLAEYRRRDGAAGKVTVADATLAHAIDIVGDQWAALIIAAMMYRVRRYDDLHEVLAVATNILADRLKRLVRSGVVQRTRYQERPPRYEYKLTPKGLDLYGFTVALHNWAEHWFVGPAGPVLKLRHQPCGRPLKTVLTCSDCGETLDPRQVNMAASRRWSAARRAAAAVP
jgi:DNA-binding HxlR family transcriptional regulator